jgi:hypothetical protein
MHPWLLILTVPLLLNIGDNHWDVAVIHGLQNEHCCNTAIGAFIDPLLMEGNRPIDPNISEEEEDESREEASGFREVDDLF